MSLRALTRPLATTTLRRITTPHPPILRASASANRTNAIGSHTNSAPQARTMASIPKTMCGISIAKTGGTEVLEYKTDLPVPEPKEGEVLVKNDFTGINYIDTYFRTGLYPAPHFPYILGREASGTIIKVGPSSPTSQSSTSSSSGSTSSPHTASSSLQSGQKVVYLSQSTYAEYTCAQSLHTYALPSSSSSNTSSNTSSSSSSITTKTASASLLQGLTALTLIREAHPVKKGDWILVHAAAGGMGLWLCQLLRAVGARTVGTASTAEKRELARQNGAEVVLPYPGEMGGGDEAFVSRIKDLTDGKGVAAVFDGVGKATFDVSLKCVARKGSLISFGNASGAVEPFAISRLSAGNVRLMRPTLFNFIAERGEFEGYTRELFEIVEREKIDVRVHEVYDLKDVARAHRDLEGRKTTGKLLLRL